MKKPVNYTLVILCLLLVAGLIATLFLPVFSLKLDIGGSNANFVNLTGMDLINTFFADAESFATQNDKVQMLLTFLGKGVVDVSQYINPLYINILTIAYIICIGFSALMFLFTIFNFAGVRLSVFNVLAGLFTFICGIVVCLCIVLQNAEFVENILLTYEFKIGIGAVILLVLGFLYMMFAPKKKA